MLGSSGPWGSCSNANIRCSNSSKHLCTLRTGVTSQRAVSIVTFRAVRKIQPRCRRQSMLPCSANRSSPPLTPFQFSLVNGPLLPSLPPDQEDRSHTAPHAIRWPPAPSIQLGLRLSYLLCILPAAPAVLWILFVTSVVSLFTLSAPFNEPGAGKGQADAGRRLEEPQGLQTRLFSPG